MDIPYRIVKVLLDDADLDDADRIDPRQYPDVYIPGYTEENGTQVFRTCGHCEKEFAGASAGRYVQGTSVSHGICTHHAAEMRSQMQRMFQGKTLPPARPSENSAPNWKQQSLTLPT